MRKRVLWYVLAIFLLDALFLAKCVSAQESPAPQTEANPQAPAPAEPPATKSSTAAREIVLPAGTRLPLVLRNGINTRTAKAGDSVYFETVYPIAQDNRMVIPMGSFLRGHILEAKRPGRVKGRGEIRMVLDSLTLPNGYTVALSATPNSADPNSRASVDREGRITGPSGVGKDVGTLGLAALAGGLEGGYVGLLARAPFRQSVAIGHGAGAAIGLAVVLLTRGPEAEVSAGTTLDVVFDQPLTLDADHLPANGPGTPPAPFPRPARPEEKNKIHHRRPPLFPFLWPRI